ncbi:hypothetical protein M0R89_18940 (plasmid) [Halorussus limi]|uniref:Uncharacterized protein n=1 Tax=Halorussus limi TaxID=2938695 RepID=A0A8U0I142_9EURY|nr:hypothetical protein [Halorussus limi]UPV76611.1 hypothetical protein M0R89_18940 [Halorussus limi]
MRRREFIAGTGIFAASALAGCAGSKSPPPRKSNVFETIEARDGKIQVALEDDTWVKSRYDGGSQNALPDPDEVGGLNPVGSVRAMGKGGGGRGATGRATGGYSSAPKTHHGRAWWHGGNYAVNWYDNHQDAVTKYGVGVSAFGVASLGSSSEMEDNAPGAGPVPWDCRVSNPNDTETCAVEREGWYRVGAELRGKNGHDFDWECVDFEVSQQITGDGYEIQKQWKVSPRI